MAQTYHIFDLESIPVPLLATLVWGLGDDSRIKRRAAGMKIDLNTMLHAAMLDRLTALVWMRTKDGAKGHNRPKSVLESLTKDNDTEAFGSAEDFENARREIIRGLENG